MPNPSNQIKETLGVIYTKYVQEKEAQEEKKRKDKLREREEAQLSESEPIEDRPLTRQEKKELALTSWKDVISGLVGDDLEYTAPKKSRKKYKRWIDDDTDSNGIFADKPKKKKKVNFNKEFESELNMLRSIVADQNKFTIDLSKRFQTMAGPNTSSSGPLSKTAVELASAVNQSRSNSLSILREIGSIKNTIAKLTMQQRKELADAGFSEQDLALMGSNLARNIIVDSNGQTTYHSPSEGPIESVGYSYSNTPSSSGFDEAFDPNSWGGGSSLTLDPMTAFEGVEVKTTVVYKPSDGTYEYKTVNISTGEELPDYPHTGFEIMTFDTDNKLAKDKFDKIYELEIME